MNEETIRQEGLRLDVPLPIGVQISRFTEGGWEGFAVYLGGLMAGDYGLNPPPNDDQVKEDLLWGVDNPSQDVIEDVDQVIEYMRLRGMVI